MRDARRAEATLERNKRATFRSTKTVVGRTKIAELEMSEYERRYWQAFGIVLRTYHAKGRSTERQLKLVAQNYDLVFGGQKVRWLLHFSAFDVYLLIIICS